MKLVRGQEQGDDITVNTENTNPPEEGVEDIETSVSDRPESVD